MEAIVLGTGAIGGFYGGKLSQGGADVSVICRSDYDIVKKQGISIKSVSGDFHFHPKQVWKASEKVIESPDIVLVGLKVLPDIDVVDLLKPIVGKHTTIVLVQNGIGIEKPIHNAFPNNEIISGLAFICVSRDAPGIVNHQDYGRLVIGNYPHGISDQAQQLARIWQDSGVACHTTEEVQTARWQKLVWNAPFNPISVLAGGVNTREMMEHPTMVPVIQAVMKEVCQLAEADRCPLNDGVIEKNLKDTQKMHPYKPSMLLDYETKRPMEVDAILGNSIQFAQQHQIAVPYMETLYALLKMKDELNFKT